MSRFMNLVVATLFVAVTFGGCGPFGGHDEPLLNQICDNKKSPTKSLASLSELEELVQQVDSVSCPDHIKSSIIHLRDLIRDHKASTCSQESANAIADYYTKYLAAKDEETDTLIEYPRALKPFFIAYGLEVSSFCRKQMVDLLVADSQQLVGEEDFQQLAEFTGEKGYVTLFMDDPKDRDDLVLPKRFVEMMDSFGTSALVGQSNEKIFLELATTKRINQLQSICEHKFKPIYRDLVLPLFTLSGVGFNYKGEPIKRPTNVNKQVYEWYRIVFFCEAINAVELFQMPEDEIKAAGSGRRLVRILEKEEADKLRASLPASKEVQLDVNRIDYHAHLKPMPLDDVVYDETDSRLSKAVMAFRRRSRKHNDPHLARKLLNSLKEKMNTGGIKLIKRFTKMKSLPDDGKVTSVDLVNFLDDYVHAMETGDSKAIAGLWGPTTKKLLKIGGAIVFIAFWVTMIIICAIQHGAFVG